MFDVGTLERDSPLFFFFFFGHLILRIPPFALFDSQAMESNFKD